jgi:hypothetical protein
MSHRKFNPEGRTMDPLITLLTNLLNLTKVAAVTVPGLLITGAFALMFWPPPPIDFIPITYPRIDSATGQWVATIKPQGRTPSEIALACDVKITTMPAGSVRRSGTEQFFPELQGWGLIERQSPLGNRQALERSLSQLNSDEAISQATGPAIRTQLLLDLEQIRLAECEDAEAELKQIKKSESDYLTSEIADLEKQRAIEKGAELSRIKKRIDDDHEALSNVQKVMAEQEREQATLKRYSDLVSSRLADPGRLRPKLDFSAFVTLQTSHVVGFIVLSIALGIIAAPLRDAFFGLLARKLFPWL